MRPEVHRNKKALQCKAFLWQRFVLENEQPLHPPRAAVRHFYKTGTSFTRFSRHKLKTAGKKTGMIRRRSLFKALITDNHH